jgi:hypothetical protein
MDKFMEYLTNPLFLILIGFIVLIFIFNTVQKMGRGKAWKQIAAETGLQSSKHQSGTYRDQQLTGNYRGRAISLTESMSEERDKFRGMNERRDTRTNTSTDIRLKINAPQDIKMKLNRIITIGEATRVTGDAEIDRHFNATSEPDWLALKVLTFATIRQKLPQLKMGGTIFIQGSEILFDQPGRISDGKYLRFLLDFLSDLADAVEGNRYG